MSSNFKYFLQKHKTRIAIGVASVLVLIILLSFVMILIGEDEPIAEYQPKLNYASHYIVGEEKNISLYNSAGNKVDSMSFDKIFYSKNRGTEMMVYADKEFLEISAITKESVNNGTSQILQKKSVLKLENVNIVSFVWNEKYIVIQRGDNTFAIYNRETETFKYLSAIENVSAYMLIGKQLVYTTGNTINSVDVTNETTVSIDVGAESYGLSLMENNIVVYNKFGNGKNTTTIFVLNPETLYIEKVLTENTLNVYPISSDKPHFIRQSNSLVFAEIQSNGKLNSSTLNVKAGEAEFTSENTLYYDDYIYSVKDGNMIIISVSGKYIEHTIPISGIAFCPVQLNKE